MSTAARELRGSIICQIQGIRHQCGWIRNEDDLEATRVIARELREAASSLERLVEYVERGQEDRYPVASHDAHTFDDFGGAA